MGEGVLAGGKLIRFKRYRVVKRALDHERWFYEPSDADVASRNRPDN